MAWALLIAATPALPAIAACPPGPALHFVALGRGLWWVPAAPGDATPANRGVVSNLLIARHEGRLWLLGSGPSPAFGRRLACRVRQHFGQDVAELIDPWARAELVLGNAGFPQARAWAHRRVAEAMAEQCVHCVERLRQRLGSASADLGDEPVVLPSQLLDGERGSLGPFDWWVLPRAADRVVTVWRHRASGVASAHGLLWFDGPPDGRDAELDTMAASTARLTRLVGAPGRWVGEQGAPGDAAAASRQANYWRALLDAAASGVARGETLGAAPPLAGVPTGLAAHPRHALNWQRAWRQAEDRLLGETKR